MSEWARHVAIGKHTLTVSAHAQQRFAERIRATDRPFDDMCECLKGAKEKHLKRAQRANTAYVPLGCCMLVCERGVVVTVLAPPSDEVTR